MKRILYTILASAVILVGNYFFSNGTLEANVETPVSTTSPIAVTPSQTAALEETCPIPTADTKLERNDNDGYCHLYPSYSTSLTGLIIINPHTNSGGDTPGDAWVSIKTETAGNRTAAQVADERIASVGEGFNITRKDVMVDGEQAVLVDGLPGQDSTRYVFIVHNNRLYTFEFAPWYPNAAAPTPLENLYATVMESLHFLPANSSEVSTGTVTSSMETSFILPTELASGTQKETVPQTSPDEPMQIWPAHTKIVLQGYPLQDTAYQPQILIFPANEYQQMSKDPASSEYDARTMIGSLQSILSTQRFPLQGYYLPALPDQHARQIFHAQETILSFKNGNGIRYITEYSQAAFPAFGGRDMLYTFQGLTNDGKYYVSVMMPINLAGLEPMPDSAANPAQYPGYLMKTISQINQAGNQFNPSLESLDALVQSLLIGAPATSDMTPSTAAPIALAQIDGLWITNVGRLNLRQDGSGEITATMEGYGDLRRQDVLQGTLNGDAVTLNSQMLGDLNLTFSDNTFKTVDGSRNAFCGIRASVSDELPAGCGFSGKWLLAPNSFFPGSSYVVLKQTAGNVNGDFYDGKDNAFDKFTGQVSWGKGWWLGGKNEKGHTITLMMNSFETGFEYIYDDLYQLKLCAVRDGFNSADLGNFICSL